MKGKSNVRTGIIGVCDMGSRLVKNLIKNGFEMSGHGREAGQKCR